MAAVTDAAQQITKAAHMIITIRTRAFLLIFFIVFLLPHQNTALTAISSITHFEFSYTYFTEALPVSVLFSDSESKLLVILYL